MTVQISAAEKVIALPAKLSRRVRERGVADALGWAWYQVAWRLRERRIGAATSEYAHGIEVGDDGEAHGYEPIDYACFDCIIDYLQPISPRDVFLDYGCGMGRAVIIAGTQPFGRVLGVEIDSQLAAVARQQIDRMRRRRKLKCPKVEIIEADAAHWAVPADVNCIFLFNSFTGDLLQAALHQVHRSALAKPRDLRIIYIQPIGDDDSLADLSWLDLETELPTGYWMHVRSRVYRVVLENVSALQGDGETNVIDA